MWILWMSRSRGDYFYVKNSVFQCVSSSLTYEHNNISDHTQPRKSDCRKWEKEFSDKISFLFISSPKTSWCIFYLTQWIFWSFFTPCPHLSVHSKFAVKQNLAILYYFIFCTENVQRNYLAKPKCRWEYNIKEAC